MKYKKKHIILLVFAVVSISTVIYFVTGFNIKDAGFKKVDKLSIKADLLGVFYGRDYTYLGFLDISEQYKEFNFPYKYKPPLTKGSPRRTFPKLAVTPDETKVFVGLNSTIFQFNTYYREPFIIKTNLKREKQTSFTPFLEASNETLYFSNFDGGNDIYECKISDPANTIKKTEYRSINRDNLAMKVLTNGYYQNLIIFDPEPFMTPYFELKKKKKWDFQNKIDKLRSPVYSFDFDIVDYKIPEGWPFPSERKPEGWVFSSNFRHGIGYSKSIYVLNNEEQPKELSKGGYAKWGADDYIYYLKETGDIYRRNPKDRIEELVFNVPNGSVNFKSILQTPIMSVDRKLLAHRFSDKIAVFDLIKKEYRIIDKVPESITDIAFIKIKPSLKNYRKGKTSYQKEDYENAIKYLKEAADKDDVLSMVSLGFMHQEGTGVSKNVKEALKYFHKAAELNDKIAQCQLGILYEDKDLTEAIEWYLRACKQNYAPAQNNLAFIYAEDNRDLIEAEELAQQAIKQKPRDPYYNGTLGWVLFKQKKYDKAIIQIEKAISLFPKEDTEAISIDTDHLGDVYHALGKNKEAKEQWQKALDFTKDAELKRKIEEKLNTTPN